MRTLPALPLLAAALLAAPASAQASFGIKAGINAADIAFSEDPTFGIDGIEDRARLGFVAGVTADVPLTPSLSLRPEVLYTQKGYVLDVNVDEVIFDEVIQFEGSQTLELSYLEVPLLLAYRFPTGSALAVSVEAGPTLAYKLDADLSCDGDLGEFEADCNEDLGEDDAIRDFDLGGALGLTVGAGPFDVGLRFTNSLLSIIDDEESTEDEDFSARNRVLTVTGTYRFGR